MSHVYNNVFPAISATAAKDTSQGLFGETWDFHEPVQLHSATPTTGTESTMFLSLENAPDRKLLHGALNSHAWALQETILSQRVLHFSFGEIYWECRNKFNQEETYELHKLDRTDGKPVFLMTLLFFPEKPSAELALGRWEKIVELYTRRDLTQPTDKLPALSGLAAIVHEHLGSRYLAGLWKDSLPAALC